MRRRLAALAALLLAALATAQTPPGTLLAVQPLGTLTGAQVDGTVGGRFRSDGETPPRASTAVDAYLLRYATTGPDGGEALAQAQLFVPRAATEDALLAFAPGSTGSDPSCSPTNVRLRGGRVETYGATALAYAGQGLATVLPDYLGATEPGSVQPYFVATAEATVVLDAVRAATRALADLAPNLVVADAFVAGFSQGGHAALATADRAAVYAREVPLSGAIGFGPSGDLDTLFRSFHYTAPWVVRAFEAAYPDQVDRHDVLAAAYANGLDADARRLCMLGAQSYYPADPQLLYTPEFHAALFGGTLAEDYPEWRALFDANDTGVRPHGLPVAIFQGVDDPVAPLASQDALVARLCELGSPVRYANYLRTRHETRYIGFRDALAWMRALAADLPPVDDCPEVAP
ncbi:MAG: lipase family protein [Trueperaceae bacterium]